MFLKAHAPLTLPGMHYAGHGWRSSTGTAYWIPVDAEHDNLPEYIPPDAINEQIRLMNARHVLLISDSCYAGTLATCGDTTSGTSTGADPVTHQRYIEQMARKNAHEH